MNCNDSHIDLKFFLANMLRLSTGGLKGLPYIIVTGHDEPAINCNNSHLTYEDLLKLSIGVDGCDKPAIRVKVIESCDPVLSCAHNTSPLNDVFAWDPTTKTYALVMNFST